MKFILKDKFIYIVGNAGLTNNKVEGVLDTNYVDNASEKSFTYSVNGGSWQEVMNRRITINTNELKAKNIKLRIKAISKSGIEMYESDVVPFTQAVVFGRKIEDAYPEVIKTLFERLDRVDKNMLSFVETLQAINKKGDLF